MASEAVVTGEMVKAVKAMPVKAVKAAAVKAVTGGQAEAASSAAAVSRGARLRDDDREETRQSERE